MQAPVITDPTPKPREIYAVGEWKNNGEMIADAAAMGYVPGLVLDATYGRGTFWKTFRPERLVTNDIVVGRADHCYDFRHFPREWERTFDCVVLDAPYKLNGTPSGDENDKRYGVDVKAKVPRRLRMQHEGLIECERIVRVGGFVLVKVQDQVASGRVHWMTRALPITAELHDLRLVDEFLYVTKKPRPQPVANQVHARRNVSSLLVFTHEVGGGRR